MEGYGVQFLVIFLSSTISSTVLLSLIGWLAKSIITERLKNAIKSEYDFKLESHKALLKSEYDTATEALKNQLKSQSDLELERIRSSLALASMEHQVKFTRLHDTQAEVIAETYRLLKLFHIAVSEYVKPIETSEDKPKEKRRDTVVECHQNFMHYYSGKRLFLSRKAVELIDNLNYQYKFVYYKFLYEVELILNDGKYAKSWSEISHTINDDIQPIFDKLEVEFRTLLGNNS